MSRPQRKSLPEENGCPSPFPLHESEQWDGERRARDSSKANLRRPRCEGQVVIADEEHACMHARPCRPPSRHGCWPATARFHSPLRRTCSSQFQPAESDGTWPSFAPAIQRLSLASLLALRATIPERDSGDRHALGERDGGGFSAAVFAWMARGPCFLHLQHSCL